MAVPWETQVWCQPCGAGKGKALPPVVCALWGLSPPTSVTAFPLTPGWVRSSIRPCPFTPASPSWASSETLPRTRHAIPCHEPPPCMGGDGESLGGRGTSRSSPSPQGKRSGKGHLHVPMPSAPAPSPQEANAIPARQLPPPLCCGCLPPHPHAASAAKASQPLQSRTSPSLRLRFIGVPSAERGWLCVCLYTRMHIYRYVPREALSSCADLHKYPIICAAPSAALVIVLTHVKLFSTFQQQL